METFIWWAAMVVAIGIGIVMLRMMHSYNSQLMGKSGLTYGQYLEEMLKETRRHNEQMERLLANMDTRLGKIEERIGKEQQS
jgi:hypothetical protein